MSAKTSFVESAGPASAPGYPLDGKPPAMEGMPGMDDQYGVESRRPLWRREEAKYAAWIAAALVVAVIANVAVAGAPACLRAGVPRSLGRRSLGVPAGCTPRLLHAQPGARTDQPSLV